MVPFVDVMVRYHGDDYMFSVMPAKPLRDMHWAGKGKDLHKVVLFTDVKVSTEGMKTKGGDVLLQAGVNSFWGKRNLHKIYGGPGICITNTPKAQISVFANAEYLTRKTVDSPKQFGGMLNLVATF
ncbi:MAG: hypothetical protein HGA67_00755 [Candidatus Yonathbacteria bacterium]|nr:hypothetical protein [Candidatus Yonathbacteria bacterium]